MTSSECRDRLRRNANHRARLHRLCRRGVWAAFECCHTAERLAGAQELEDHFLAIARLTQDLDAPRADQPEPGGRVSLGEEVLASRVAVLAGDGGQGCGL